MQLGECLPAVPLGFLASSPWMVTIATGLVCDGVRFWKTWREPRETRKAGGVHHNATPAETENLLPEVSAVALGNPVASGDQRVPENPVATKLLSDSCRDANRLPGDLIPGPALERRQP